MDIYQRTCLKEGLLFDDLHEDEVEITHTDSTEDLLEEEQAEEEEKQINLQALQIELECMKRRIQKLQQKLKIKLEKCPNEECVDFEVELKCSQNKEICALQKAQHKLQCQINELIRCCKFAKEQIEDLRSRMCERVREIQRLEKHVDELQSWKSTLQHEFGVCIERFEYLKHVKAEWKDVEQLIEQQKKCFSKMTQNFVPQSCFIEEKKLFLIEINDLQNLYKELFKLQLERFFNMEERLNEAALKPAVAAIATVSATIASLNNATKTDEQEI